MKTLLFVLVPVAIVLNSFGPAAEVNDFKYEVSLDGKPIGSYMVNKTSIGDLETYRVETETAAGLIGRMSHRFVMKSSFDKNTLVAADIKTWVNDDLETSSSIKWDGGRYVKQEGENLMEICCDAIDYSSASLFFHEPVSRTSVFNEKYGKSLPLKLVGEHQYEVKLPNGGFERYTYKNGSVSEVQFVKSFTTLTLRSS